MRKHKNPIFLITLFAIVGILAGGCGKDKNDHPKKITDSRDGTVYETVSIGNQVWMAENLRATVYNDGTPIELFTDSADWAAQTNGAYCWYDNNEIEYAEAYGALYNWYAVETGKLCPTGWHVPTKSEWRVMKEYVGDSIAGGRLKSIRTAPDTHPRWDSPNTGAVDEYDFSAFPGGLRDSDGRFNGIGIWGGWWSSSEFYDNRNSVHWFMNKDNEYLTGLAIPQELGFSVRCVKD